MDARRTFLRTLAGGLGGACAWVVGAAGRAGEPPAAGQAPAAVPVSGEPAAAPRTQDLSALVTKNFSGRG